MKCNERFRLAGGSVPGADHLGRNDLLKGVNNQDAYLFTDPAGLRPEAAIIAAVCDGCGGGLTRADNRVGPRRSEVGAWIGAALLVRHLSEQYQRIATDASHAAVASAPFWERVRQDLLAELRVLALAMTGPGESFAQTVQEYFLFTVLGALITPLRTCIVGIGDGLYSINGDLRRIGPFPGNMPPYLAYGLIDTVDFADRQDLLHFTVHEHLATADVESILLASDGACDLQERENCRIPGDSELVGPLSQFWSDDRYFNNRYAIQRRLCRLNSEVTLLDSTAGPATLTASPRLLPDDTTLVVIRRESLPST